MNPLNKLIASKLIETGVWKVLRLSLDFDRANAIKARTITRVIEVINQEIAGVDPND